MLYTPSKCCCLSVKKPCHDVFMWTAFSYQARTKTYLLK